MSEEAPGGFGEVEEVETGREAQVPLPKHLMHLAEREREQALSLQKLFAEQEHGLRQSYADWLLWLLGAPVSRR